MGWFRGGFYGAWYAGFAAAFAAGVGTHPAPGLYALACFVFIPVLLLGVCGHLDAEALAARRAVVEAAFSAGQLGRAAAAGAGAAGAVLGMGLTGLALTLLDAVGPWAIPFALAAPVGGYWVALAGVGEWTGRGAVMPKDQ